MPRRAPSTRRPFRSLGNLGGRTTASSSRAPRSSSPSNVSNRRLNSWAPPTPSPPRPGSTGQSRSNLVTTPAWGPAGPTRASKPSNWPSSVAAPQIGRARALAPGSSSLQIDSQGLAVPACSRLDRLHHPRRSGPLEYRNRETKWHRVGFQDGSIPAWLEQFLRFPGLRSSHEPGRYPVAVTLHATLPAELQDAVTRARQRAALTGEFFPSSEIPARTPMSADVAKFVRQILTDGSYQEEITRIGKEDPDLASM